MRNYMDYGDDPCMDNFTPDQLKRLQSLYAEFRANYKGPLPSQSKTEDRTTIADREVRRPIARDEQVAEVS